MFQFRNLFGPIRLCSLLLLHQLLLLSHILLLAKPVFRILVLFLDESYVRILEALVAMGLFQVVYLSQDSPLPLLYFRKGQMAF